MQAAPGARAIKWCRSGNAVGHVEGRRIGRRMQPKQEPLVTKISQTSPAFRLDRRLLDCHCEHSEAKPSRGRCPRTTGLPRRDAPRNDNVGQSMAFPVVSGANDQRDDDARGTSGGTHHHRAAKANIIVDCDVRWEPDLLRRWPRWRRSVALRAARLTTPDPFANAWRIIGRSSSTR
jgi:hypothetical protein